MNILGGDNEKTCISAHGRTNMQFLSGKVQTKPLPKYAISWLFVVRGIVNKIPFNNLPFIRSSKETSGIYCFPWAFQQAVPALPFKANEVSVHSFANVLGGEECWISRCRRTLASELDFGGVSRDGRGQRESYRGA